MRGSAGGSGPILNECLVWPIDMPPSSYSRSAGCRQNGLGLPVNTFWLPHSPTLRRMARTLGFIDAGHAATPIATPAMPPTRRPEMLHRRSHICGAEGTRRHLVLVQFLTVMVTNRAGGLEGARCTPASGASGQP